MSEVNLSSSVGFSNSSLSNQCSTVAVFTEPTSRSQKRVRKVLEEEDYIEKIDKIIERDFFPDVAKLKAQLAYQEASERGDLVEMARLREQWTQSRPETVRSSVLDTPVILSRTDEESKLNHSEGDKEPAVPDATLDKFLVKYTSEDNASFQEILDETKAREMVKYPWLFLNEEKANQEVNEAKSLPSIETQAIEDKRPAGLLTWHFKNKNTVMYYPEEPS
ncbi:hypothetical protein HDE_06513 [Halotydeus destructor]|nr:hypothetical protein HDE_06513 [Halotydeus destructor]